MYVYIIQYTYLLGNLALVRVQAVVGCWYLAELQGLANIVKRPLKLYRRCDAVLLAYQE